MTTPAAAVPPLPLLLLKQLGAASESEHNYKFGAVPAALLGEPLPGCPVRVLPIPPESVRVLSARGALVLEARALGDPLHGRVLASESSLPSPPSQVLPSESPLPSYRFRALASVSSLPSPAFPSPHSPFICLPSLLLRAPPFRVLTSEFSISESFRALLR